MARNIVAQEEHPVYPGFFYKLLDENEVPVWLRQDAKKHLHAVSQDLQLTEVPKIQWWMPLYGAEVPEQLMERARNWTGIMDQLQGQSLNATVYDEPSWLQDWPGYHWATNMVSGWASYEAGTINIADSGSRFHVVLVVAHEARHFWQHENQYEGGSKEFWGHEDRPSEQDAEGYAIQYLNTWVFPAWGLELTLGEFSVPVLKIPSSQDVQEQGQQDKEVANVSA